MDEPPKGLERRLVYRFLMRWREAQDDDEIPSLAAVSKQDLADIWPNVFVLSNVDGDGEPLFERVGDAFGEEGGADLVGKPMSQVAKNTLIAQGVGNYKVVVDKRVPMTANSEFVNAGGQKILCRSATLPLSDKPGIITRVICAANSRKEDDA